MCGIAGRVNLDESAVCARELRRMAEALQHRGPDAEGYYSSGGVGFAHRRLAVIDLSSAANQPFVNEDGTIALVFNGEIYNFVELRSRLEKLGHRFRSRSDGEVILHAYEESGIERTLTQLRGMFAFALWDTRSKTLVAARDRCGQKPFKYFFDGRTFLFGSELKALLVCPEVSRDPDYQAIDDYFTAGYVPPPATGFRDVRKLAAAHYLELSAHAGLRVQRYWAPSFARDSPLEKGEWLDQLDARLKESVALRLRTDRPLGVFLSGGLDSSLVASYMTELSGRPVSAFSLAFEDDPKDELPWAQEMARHIGARHAWFTLGSRQAARILPTVVQQLEEPYADASVLATYELARQVRSDVTVVLNGDGGDEVFAGYPRYWRYLRAWKLQALPEPLRRYLLGPLARRGARFHRRLDQVAGTLTGWEEQQVSRGFFSYVPLAMKQRLYRDDFAAAVEPGHFFDLRAALQDESGERHPLNRVLFAEFATYLAEDLLVKMDMATMAHGLEARSPFLDQELVDFGASLPVALKLSTSKGKLPLRRLARHRLPESLLKRPKRGFSIPLSRWLHSGFRDSMEERLLSSEAPYRKLLDGGVVEGLLRRLSTGESSSHRVLWSVFLLDYWLENYDVALP